MPRILLTAISEFACKPFMPEKNADPEKIKRPEQEF